MAASVSRSQPTRAVRMASLLRKYGFGLAPVRVQPIEETAYRAIQPMMYRASDRIVDGVMASHIETYLMRRRAFAARAWLARRLASMAEHEGFRIAWMGSYREDLYNARAYHRAYLHARAEVRGMR